MLIERKGVKNGALNAYLENSAEVFSKTKL